MFRTIVITGAVIGLAACSSAAAKDAGPVSPTQPQQIQLAQHAGSTADATTLTVTPVAAIRAELPAAIRNRGSLIVGVGALPTGFPPLAYVGDDQRTLTGAEPDLGRLLGGVLGVKVDLQNSSWDNMFVRIDSGQVDVGLSNIADTELRKQKYDFASYRLSTMAFETTASSTWSFNGDYRNLAGKTIAVGSGTNQEKILLAWQSKLKAAGQNVTLRYFNDTNSQLLALQSGRIDAYFGPNPSVQYQVAQNAKGPKPLRNAGTYVGTGATKDGFTVAATTKKGNGLAKPLADAINDLIKTGAYTRWLAAYHLSDEAVTTSRVNPPGVPLTNQ